MNEATNRTRGWHAETPALSGHSLVDTRNWTQYAMQNGPQGMSSWRLDNDHGTQGQEEDVDPAFTGAKTLYDTVNGGS